MKDEDDLLAMSNTDYTAIATVTLAAGGATLANGAPKDSAVMNGIYGLAGSYTLLFLRKLYAIDKMSPEEMGAAVEKQSKPKSKL